MSIEVDYSILTSWARSNATPPVLTISNEIVENYLYGPDGEILKYVVDKRRVPIGYQKEPK